MWPVMRAMTSTSRAAASPANMRDQPLLSLYWASPKFGELEKLGRADDEPEAMTWIMMRSTTKNFRIALRVSSRLAPQTLQCSLKILHHLSHHSPIMQKRYRYLYLEEIRIAVDHNRSATIGNTDFFRI